MSSYIRLFNASPKTKAVDVYANGYLVEENLDYKMVSQYFSMVPGNYNFSIYPTGQRMNPLLNADLYIPDRMIFNVAIIPFPPAVGLYPLPEPDKAQNFGKACIRFVNLSSNLPSVDLTLPDGSKLFKTVSHEEFTKYACLPSGNYNFQIWSSEGSKFIGNVSSIKLGENQYFTLYAVGEFNDSAPVEVVLLKEPR